MNRASPLTICVLSLSFLVSCKPTEDGFDPSAPTTLAPDEPSSCKEAMQEGGVQRLDRWVLSESCKKADFDADAALSKLREEGAAAVGDPQAEVIYRLDGEQAKELGAPPPRGKLAVDVYVSAPMSLSRTRVVVKRHDYAGAGIQLAIGPYRIGQKNGHPQITRAALRRLALEQVPGFAEFTPSAIDLLADASQDPDFYEWEHPEAHAQTGNAPDASPTAFDWQERWQKWMQTQLARSRQAADSGDAKQALYFLGYALHGVEDLATHQGRTNAEHSYQAFLLRKDPDEDDAAIERAVDYAARFLRLIPSKYGNAWKEIPKSSGPSRMDKEEKQAILGHGWDFGADALLRYRSLAEPFARAARSPRVIVRFCNVTDKPGKLPTCESLVDAVGKL